MTQLLEKQFGIVISAPDGIERLRGLILNFAVQGKLVRQNAGDGNTKELIEDAEGKKQQLVKEKKIKKPKPVSKVMDKDLPYDVPSSWSWVRLGSIGEINPRNVAEDSDEAGFVPMPLVLSGYGKTHSFKSRKWLEIKKGYTHFANGDVGLAKITPCFENGKSCIFENLPNGIGAGTTEFHVFRNTFGLVSPPYLLAYLKNPKYIASNVLKMTGSAGQKRVSTDVFSNSLFPLPPLAEQKRIVAKIDQLMARCNELEKPRAERDRKQITVHTAALNRLLTAPDTDTFTQSWQFITKHFSELYSVKENVTELRKAILQLAVMGKLVPQDQNEPSIKEVLEEIESERSDLVERKKIKRYKLLPKINLVDIPYQLPESWEWVRLIDIVDVGTGSTPTKANHEYYNGTVPWYTSSATNNIMAEEPTIFITEKALSETNCKIFPAGSLIIALYGQGKTRGQISELSVPGATNQAIAAMIFYESSLEMKSYVKYYFVKIYEEIRSRAEGGAQPNLNVGKVKDTLIPLPSIPEQHRIVTKVDQLMALCDQLEQQIDAATHKQTALLNAVIAQA